MQFKGIVEEDNDQLDNEDEIKVVNSSLKQVSKDTNEEK